MRILVTGGTGYLGRAIVRALARRGHEVVVFARTASEAVAAGLPASPVDGDVRDGPALSAAAAGSEAICHTAALVSVWRRDRRAFGDVNVGGLHHALAAARVNDIRRIVYTSSFLARPPSGPARQARPLAANDYQRTKLAAEQAAAEAVAGGLPVIRLYPGVIYGPGEPTAGNLVGRLVADHLRGRLPGIVGADRIWSFAFVEDVAEAHAVALERGVPGAAYALGGENLPQMRAFEIVRDVTGRRLPRRIPAWLAYALGTVEELRATWTRGTPLLTRGAVEILLRDWALDSAPAIRDLDYRITPLTDGITAVLSSLGGQRSA